jgi:SAM-dependent methyltransferase
MLEDYATIFTERGSAYHEAMTRWPAAREEELLLLVRALQPQRGEVLVDAPAGGGYLAAWLPPGVQYVAVEPASPFFSRCPVDADHRRVQCPLSKIELPDASADLAISLAGLHHEPHVDEVFAELVRVLRPGGRFGMAEVQLGSPAARFLNGFVDAHGRLGHHGVFFEDTLADRLREVGLREVSLSLVPLHWNFPDEPAMIRFVRLLFGIDRATDAEVAAAIEELLGSESLPEGGVAMCWQLLTATGRKAG